MHRVTEGKTSEGQDASFRAVIDVYFNSRPKEFLTTVDFELTYDTEDESSHTEPNAPDIVTKIEILEAGE